jgi:DNA-binding response OmpR family regulator
MARVLVVERDPAVRRLIVERLGREEHEVVADRDHLIAADLATLVPDLIVLELPEDELEPLPLVRRHSKVPTVAILTPRGPQREADVLDAGADDVLRKPLSLRDLVARCNAVLRRAGPRLGSTRLEFEGLVIDRSSRLVEVAGHGTVELPHREFDLLVHLANAPGRVFSREQLLQSVWDASDVWLGTATVTEHVYRLRRHLGPVGARCISTVRSVGYRFNPTPVLSPRERRASRTRPALEAEAGSGSARIP